MTQEQFNVKEAEYLDSTLSPETKAYLVSQGMPPDYNTYQQAYDYIIKITNASIYVTIECDGQKFTSHAAVPDMFLSLCLPVGKIAETDDNDRPTCS